MFVTAFTDNDTELPYESGQSPVFHIKSKTFDEKKNIYIFRTDNVDLSYYYDGNLEILKLERLRQDYIATNQASKEDGYKDPALLFCPSLPDLAG